MIRFDRVLMVPEWLIPRWWRIAYLIIDHLREDLVAVARVRPDEKFDAFVVNQLQSFVKEGTAPDAILPAILNLHDDLAAGREMTMRAGDYIALQGYFRQQKGRTAKK